MSHRRMLLWYTAENVGLLQVEDYVYVLSKCCGARFTSLGSSLNCAVCRSIMPNIEVMDPDSALSSPCILGPSIKLQELDKGRRFIWWAKEWTKLELEIEVSWT